MRLARPLAQPLAQRIARPLSGARGALPRFVLGSTFGADSGDLCTVPVYAEAETAGCSALHPSVLHFASGFGGYTYWMAFTPYKVGGAEFENPSIVASNDGVTWAVPSGVTNPLVPSPAGSAYNADTHLSYIDGKMRIVFAAVEFPSAGRITIYLMESDDGVTWGSPIALFDYAYAVTGCGSPALLKIGGVWTLFGANNAPDPPVIERWTAAELTGEWTDQGAVTAPDFREYWHLDVQRLGSRLVMLGDMLDIYGRHTLNFLVSSDAGLTWTTDATFPHAMTRDAGNAAYYKAALVLARFGGSVYGKMWHTDGTPTYMRVAELSLQSKMADDYVESAIAAAIAETPGYTVADTFTRADGNLTGATPDVGPNWGTFYGTCVISSNKAARGAANGENHLNVAFSNGLIGVRLAPFSAAGGWSLFGRSNFPTTIKRLWVEYAGRNFVIKSYVTETTTYLTIPLTIVGSGDMDTLDVFLRYVDDEMELILNGRVFAKCTLSSAHLAGLAGFTAAGFSLLDASTKIDSFFAHT